MVQYRVFTFSKISDAEDIFQIEPGELPNIRLTAGGIKVLSGGVWSKVTPYVDRPAEPGYKAVSKALPYKTGLILNIDDGTNGMLVQMDNRGFILFRCLRGTVTVPLIDGYSYEHTGTLSDSTITLSAGQYALFYRLYRPTLGTYLTYDVEHGTGLRVNATTLDGTSLAFYLNFGYGEAQWTIQYPDALVYMRYGDGEYSAPVLPELFGRWTYRSSYQHTHIFTVYDYVNYPIIDDPNTTQNWILDHVITKIYVGENGNTFNFAYEFELHDTTHTHRATLRAVLEYEHDTENDMWKVRCYLKLVTLTDIQSLDETIDPALHQIGFSIRTGTGKFFATGEYYPEDSYYGFNPSAGAWEALSFQSGWTVRTGYRGTRFTITINGTTVHIYTKYIAKGGSVTLATYKHRREHVDAFLAHYYSELADVQIPQNNIIAYGVEMWYAKSDIYEDPVPAETDYGSDTSFIDNYFVGVGYPKFVLVDVTPTSVNVKVSSTFTVDVTIRNDGDVPGTCVVSLADHEGNIQSTKYDTINPGEEKTFTLTGVAPGYVTEVPYRIKWGAV